MLSNNRGGLVFAARHAGHALNEWREAALLVSTRWALFLQAEEDARSFAFASYVAALDAEEAAAARMAGLLTPAAA